MKYTKLFLTKIGIDNVVELTAVDCFRRANKVASVT